MTKFLDVNWTALLEVYSIEEIFERLDLTQEEVLEILKVEGVFEKWDAPLPLQ